MSEEQSAVKAAWIAYCEQRWPATLERDAHAFEGEEVDPLFLAGWEARQATERPSGADIGWRSVARHAEERAREAEAGVVELERRQSAEYVRGWNDGEADAESLRVRAEEAFARIAELEHRCSMQQTVVDEQRRVLRMTAQERERATALREAVEAYNAFRGLSGLWWLEQMRDHGSYNTYGWACQPDPEKAVSTVAHSHLLAQLIAAQRALDAIESALAIDGQK